MMAKASLLMMAEPLVVAEQVRITLVARTNASPVRRAGATTAHSLCADTTHWNFRCLRSSPFLFKWRVV